MANLKAEAASLLRGLVSDYDGASGSISCTVYDTAWVSMVTKTVDNREIWLFPTSFRYILDSQQPDGGWEPYASNYDGLMNTMAALLALSRHRDAHLQLGELMPLDIDARISRAVVVLRQRLMTWNVNEEWHVGFELIVPTLLRLLREAGFTFSFPGEHSLMELQAQKLSRFDPAVLYQDTQTAALYSLEAFIGTVDFDRLKHHTRMHGMMGSPSSTAAYLQHISAWDSDAEKYLCSVVSDGEGRGTGGIPGTFPSTNFEMLWCQPFYMGISPRTNLVVISYRVLLESSFRSGNGLLSFANEARNLTPDTDCTSMAITILRTLNRPAPVEQMTKHFEAKDHFRTNSFERNPSFSVNCNILTSLLSAEQCLGDNATQIEKALRFLCDTWWNSDLRIKDKWNLSPHYSEMLLSQSLMRFLLLWDQGKISVFQGDTPLIQNILIMLFQVLIRVLQVQNVDGSWGNRQAEPTAYAVLTLISLQSRPIVKPPQSHIDSAVQKGREFLVNPPSNIAVDFIWIGKVTYHVKNLSQAYTIAAMNASPSKYRFEGNLQHASHLPLAKIVKFKKFYLKLPIFAAAPEWLVEASLIEGYLFLPQLNEIRLGIFPQRKMEEDKYFEYIPFPWVAGNILEKAHYRANFVREMTIITFLSKQADEYMETKFSTCFAGRSIEARQIIDSLLDNLEPATNGHGEMQHDASKSTTDVSDNTLQVWAFSSEMPRPVAKQHAEQDMEVYQTLRRFIQHVLCHPAVGAASEYDKTRLRQELRHYFLAEIERIEDNTKFSQDSQQDSTALYQNSNRTFFDWVRTAASNDTTCPYAFSFAICLLGNGHDFFSTDTEKYLGQAACRHLATLCRMYNDCGSVVRDRQEKNLNSLNFPEFHVAQSSEEDEVLKERLMSLAAFERKCLGLAVGELEPESQEIVMRFMRFFINVVDLYGQIYVAKDIGSRVK